MILEKLKWAYRLLRSRTFLVLTDKASVVSIPLVDIQAHESVFLLSAQTASLQEFKSRLEDLINEHEEAIQLLAYRKGVSKASSAKKSNGTKVRRSTKKR